MCAAHRDAAQRRATSRRPTPALELTLTDTQDAPLARRVLFRSTSAAHRPGYGNWLAAGAEATFKIASAALRMKAAGYRLYLFFRDPMYALIDYSSSFP